MMLCMLWIPITLQPLCSREWQFLFGQQYVMEFFHCLVAPLRVVT